MSDRLRDLFTVYDLHEDDKATAALSLRRECFSPTEVAEALHSPPEHVSMQLLLCDPESEASEVKYFELGLELNRKFLTELRDSRRSRFENRPINAECESTYDILDEPNFIVFGDGGMARFVPSGDHGALDSRRAVPVIFITVLRGWRAQTKKGEECINTILCRLDTIQKRKAAIEIAAILFLVADETLLIRAALCSVRSEYGRPGGDEDLKRVREDWKWLRRIIDDGDNQWDSVMRYVRFHHGEDSVSHCLDTSIVKKYKGILGQVRRLEPEMRDVLNIAVGQLALEESRKSIELSNRQIQEGKRSTFHIWFRLRTD
ncbi:hypothetical protein ACLMJK_000053 [Lecanora helva]